MKVGLSCWENIWAGVFFKPELQSYTKFTKCDPFIKDVLAFMNVIESLDYRVP
jgi:hypothetical protein